MNRPTAVILIATIVVLAWMHNPAWADPLKVTQETYDAYQEYLQAVQGTKQGAFAVSQDGVWSNYVYCAEEDCVLTELAREAIAGCEQNGQMKCMLLATNRDAKLEVEVQQ
jgi:hypothetical protein